MQIKVSEHNLIRLDKVFNPIELVTDDGEVMAICMRDSGFEFEYQGEKYEAKEGVVLHHRNTHVEVINKATPEKPPIGIPPTIFFLEDRLKGLDEAICKRINTNSDVPDHWIQERNKILEWVEELSEPSFVGSEATDG